ncbi:MAG: hypothetical protein JST82_10175 [Bacteroidetes bacterium]|nr:hypothetical protein [Bacteroidota bacterium]
MQQVAPAAVLQSANVKYEVYISSHFSYWQLQAVFTALTKGAAPGIFPSRALCCAGFYATSPLGTTTTTTQRFLTF